MAAFDTDWTFYMTSDAPSSFQPSPAAPSAPSTSHSTTYATFSAPPSSSHRTPSFKVQQKSPLLAATPPQITRALSHSYPYVRAANVFFGWLTWTTGDPWDSFVLVCAFWASVLYGDVVIKWAGPLVAFLVLLVSVWVSTRQSIYEKQHPSLDLIVDTLNSLTSRLTLFMGPLSHATSILASRRATPAPVPATPLGTLALRLLLVLPLWYLLSAESFIIYQLPPPFPLLTPRRAILTIGTFVLSYHSKPAKVTRTLLWRSALIRSVCETLTGLDLTPETDQKLTPGNATSTNGTKSTTRPAHTRTASSTTTPLNPPLAALRRKQSLAPDSAAPVRFTFAIYENQRRWLGVGWTASLFAYERAPWTDEHLQVCAPPWEFELPKGGWRWVRGEEWAIEDGQDKKREKAVENGTNVDSSAASTLSRTSSRTGTIDEEGGTASDDADAASIKTTETKDDAASIASKATTKTTEKVKDAKLAAKERILEKEGGAAGEMGWIYYDNKWRDGRRGKDGWGKYTRRRKWYRNAELAGGEEDVQEGENRVEEVEENEGVGNEVKL